MQNTRIVPHRPKREEAKTREVSDLKRENHKLKRAVKRLEKEIRKRSSIEEEVAEETPAEEPVELQCPDCESYEVTELSVGPITMRICRICRWRKKVESVLESNVA